MRLEGLPLNLWLTFSFCNYWWNRTDAPQVLWFYFSALLLNLAIRKPLKTYMVSVRGG
ncbi:MAG: hypothetical protein QW756_03640 [Nitrososphaerota archaeon]